MEFLTVAPPPALGNIFGIKLTLKQNTNPLNAALTFKGV